jgi:hypothetical protein
MKNLITLICSILIFPGLVMAIDSSIDGQFATPTNLTDKEMENAKNFIHQGVKDRKIQEGCKGLNNCLDDESGFPLEQIIGKAYVMMGMFTGDGIVPKLTKRPVTSSDEKAKTGPANLPEVVETLNKEAAKPTKPKELKKEQKTDYCMIVAMSYELVGSALQTSLQKKAENRSSAITDPQLASLVNLRETHKARKTTASWQRNIYAGVTACYGYQMVAGGVQTDAKFVAKMAGASALTYLYQRKVSKHNDAAKKVQLVIDSLPKASDCNPWTGTKCFCSEKTSKDRYPLEYQQVCVLNDGNFETPKVALGCGTIVDKNVTFDKECKCKATNTCIQGYINPSGGISGIGINLLNEANKNFGLLGSGEFDQAKFDAASLSAQHLAAAVKLPVPKDVPHYELTTDQKKMADHLSQFAPANIAAMAAASNSTGFKSGIKDSPISSAAINKLTPELRQKVAEAVKINYRQGDSQNGSASADEEEIFIPGFGTSSPEAHSGTEVMSFTEQAVSKADVSNAPDTPIFDIISNRYRRSGWNKLESGVK